MSNISGTIKSIRDIFRKDPGLSGDAQRIEQLGWMIFLKLFDDKDKERELLDRKYKSPIPSFYQWRTWAENDEGETGERLISFVNNDLFPALKNLRIGTDDKLGVIIRNIFDGTNNYMKSGTTFRQAINKLNEIDFNSSKEHHIFNAIYEDILQGLATKKDTGEFYTPRAVTQFIIDMVNPALGEKIIDPACGTAGFLVCAIEHLRKQVKTVADKKKLQENITGTELKPLPFMLSIVNLITHDIEVPQILNMDALSRELTSIRQADRVDIIVANPPFGGVVGDGMETNFPLNYRTKESADLFLILFIQLLKDGGRAGIVLPDGSLTGEGVKQRVRQKLLEDCNVHTIVRLPQSVFAPYATVNTNLIFFEKGKPTKEIWYYEHTLPEGAKAYNKTKPIRIEEFDPIQQWWTNRTESEVCWKVPIEKVIERGYDLDIKNPTRKPKQILNFREAVNKQKETEENIYVALEQFSIGLKILNSTSEVDNLFKYIGKVIDVPKAILQIESFLLDLAVQGKLLKQDITDEPASKLLRRIQAAKAASGKKGNLLTAIKPEEIPFDIPNSWVWCRLGEICSKIGSGSTPKGSNYSTVGYPFFRSQNIYNDAIVYDDIKFISEDVQKQMKGTAVFANDILLNITGGSLGRCALVPSDFKEGNVSQHVCIIRPLEADINYFHKVVLSPYFQRFIFSSTTGAGREGLPKYNLEQLVIPIPPLAEQKRIVSEIEKQLAKTKQLKKQIIAYQQAKEQLLKALLHQAFEGEEKATAPAKKATGKLVPLPVDDGYYDNIVAEAEATYQQSEKASK